METPTSRQRFYYNGKLTKTSSPRDIATLRQFLNNIEADWSRNIRPALQPGQFDYNQATEVRRVSADELHVTTTGGHKLRWVNVEVRQ